MQHLQHSSSLHHSLFYYQFLVLPNRMNLIYLASSFLLLIEISLSLPPFTAHQIILWQGSTTSHNSGGVNTFTVSLSQTYNSSYKSSLVLSGYKWQTNNNIKYFTTVTVSGTTCTATLINYAGSGIYYMSFHVLLVNIDYSWIDLKKGCVNCAVLNAFSRSATTQDFTITTSMIITNPAGIMVKPFITDIDASSTSVLVGFINIPQPMEAALTFKTINTPSSIIITITSSNTGRLITTLCYSVLIYNATKLVNVNIAYYTGSVSVSTSVKLDSQSNLMIPALYGPIFNVKCVIGISSFVLYGFSGLRQMFFNSQTNGITEKKTTPGLWPPFNIPDDIRANYNIFCMVDCPITEFFDLANQVCSPCSIQYCLNCITFTLCESCVTSSYSVGPLGTCVTCDSLMSGCLTCSNSTCLACTNNSYVLNSTTSKCDHCSLNLSDCLTCQNSSYCLSCTNSSFVLAPNGCINCALLFTSCFNCTTQQCIACVNNTFFLNTTGCYLCETQILNCDQCFNKTNCSACINSSYVLTSGQCPLCNVTYPNCLICANGLCTQCVNNTFYLNSSGCFICSTNYPNCSTCSSQLVCTTCDLNFFDNSSNLSCQTCLTRIDYCQTCQTLTTCSLCNSTTFGTDSSNLCVACGSLISNCNECLNFTYCISCINISYAITTISSTNISCQTCSSLISNCQLCSDSSTCLTCNTSYYVNTTNGCSSCNSTLSNCLICPNSLVCNICESNLYYLNSSWLCSVCAAALNQCYQCYNSTYCKSCITNNYFVDINIGQCVPCNHHFNNCTQCNLTSNRCTLCENKFYINSQGTCSCLVGFLVSGICITITGCVSAAVQNGTIICLSCNISLFTAVPVNNKCFCTVGELINGICSTLTGCLAPIPQNGSFVCAFCSIGDNFVMDEFGNCICKSKYWLKAKICDEICGDGFVLHFACDDNNQVDGDGCSSLCVIEEHYKCYNGSTITKSDCVYQGIPLSMSLTKISRNQELNQGSFEFKVYPPVLNVGKMDLMSLANFHCESSFTVSQITYSDGILKIVVDYTKDLEGLTAQLFVEFDSDIIISPNVSLSFNIKSSNSPLRISNNLHQVKNFKMIFSFLSYAVLVLFAISLSHKMIGVQLLSTCQIAYFANAMLARGSLLFSSIKSFKLVNGYKQIFHKDSDSDFLSGFSRNIEINPQFLENTAFVNAVQITVLVIWIYFVFKQQEAHYSRNIKKARSPFSLDQVQQRCFRLKKMYYVLIFPLMVGFFFQISISAHVGDLRVAVNGQTFSTMLNSLIEFVIFLGFGVIVGIQGLNLFCKKDSHPIMRGMDRCSNAYIPLFLLKLFTLSVLIEMGIHNSFEMNIYLIVGTVSLSLLALLIFRPYKRTIDNFGIIFNQIFALSVVCFALSSYYFQIQEDIQLLLVFSFQLVILLILIISGIRIFYAYRDLIKAKPMKQHSQSRIRLLNKTDKQAEQIQNVMKQKQITNMFQKMNPYRFQNQLVLEHKLVQNQINRQEMRHLPFLKPQNYYDFIQNQLQQKIKKQGQKQLEKDQLKEIKKRLRKDFMQFKIDRNFQE